MRKPIIAGNWKMYKTIPQAIELVNGLKRELSDFVGADIVVCPTYTALSEVSEVLADSSIKLGAQDMYWQDEGAYTGEISASMLKDVGVSFVILGHSERRQHFQETDEAVNNKIKAALMAEITPICCIGEKLEQREANQTYDVVQRQLQAALKDIKEAQVKKIVFAYEPIWAIGTGKTATSAQAQEVHKFLRSLLEKWYNKEVASSVRIQYGGSVKPENIADLMKAADIDGALVGGASLGIESFSQIVKRCTVS
ncbi:MAG: triose-phosphate isomerase [Candidatus Omnitrophica bacterium]|nr:triose-phosphate isomerase [Candidatus Omnitrophota bacterium]